MAALTQKRQEAYVKTVLSRTLILSCLSAGLYLATAQASELSELAIITPDNSAAYQTVITRDQPFDLNLRGMFSLRLASEKQNAPYNPLALTNKGNGSLYLADLGQTQRISDRKVENGILSFTVTDHKGQRWQWQMTAIKAPAEYPLANVLISIKSDLQHESRTVYGELKPIS